MREAISEYVAREEARESFKDEALASWAEFPETGLHLTGEELRNCLDRWGTQEETGLPACHE
jgi:predicted transcriptional regulator